MSGSVGSFLARIRCLRSMAGIFLRGNERATRTKQTGSFQDVCIADVRWIYDNGIRGRGDEFICIMPRLDER